MALVVDASMAVAWFVVGQATAHTRKVFVRAAKDAPLLEAARKAGVTLA